MPLPERQDILWQDVTTVPASTEYTSPWIETAGVKTLLFWCVQSQAEIQQSMDASTVDLSSGALTLAYFRVRYLNTNAFSVPMRVSVRIGEAS